MRTSRVETTKCHEEQSRPFTDAGQSNTWSYHGNHNENTLTTETFLEERCIKNSNNSADQLEKIRNDVQEYNTKLL